MSASAASGYSVYLGGGAAYVGDTSPYGYMSSWSWSAPVSNEGCGSSSGPCASVGYQNSGAFSETVYSGGPAIIEGIGVGSSSYSLVAQSTPSFSGTSPNVAITISKSNSLVIIVIACGGSNTGGCSGYSTTLPSCVVEIQLATTSAGASAGGFIVACTNVPSGTYSLALTSPAQTEAAVEVYAFPNQNSGGCVLGSDLVQLYNGAAIPVSSLKQGEYIMGYNTTSGKEVPERVSYITVTNSSTIEMINGNVGVTPTDQPVYISNGTYTGWINNPDAIKVGWSMYSPSTGTWTKVNSIEYLPGSYKVYNIYSTGSNNFIINGVLADVK